MTDSWPGRHGRLLLSYQSRRLLVERMKRPVYSQRPRQISGDLPAVPPPRALRLCALAATVANVLLSLTLLARASLWGDEGFVGRMVQLQWSDMLRDLGSIDYNMSAYYIVVKAWTSLAGFSEASLRFPSLVFSVVTMVGLGRLTRRVYGDRAGWMAVILLAANPFSFVIGITARPFAMLACVTVLSTLHLLRALGSSRARGWVLVALLDVLSIHVSMLAFLVVAAHGFFVLTAVRPLSRVHLASGAVVILGALPSIFFVAPKDTLAWIPPVTLGRIVTEASWAVGGRVLIALLTGAVLAALVRAPPCTREVDGARVGRLLPICLLTPVVIFVLLLPYQSLFISTYLYLVVPFALALAAAAAANLARPAGMVLLSLIAAAGAAGLVRHDLPNPAVGVQDWRGTGHALDRVVLRGDAVVYPNVFYRVVGEYYAPRSSGWQALATPLLPNRPWDRLTPYELDRLKRLKLTLPPAVVHREIAGHDRIWLVAPKMDDAMRWDARILEAAGYHRTKQLQQPGVEVWLYSAIR